MIHSALEPKQRSYSENQVKYSYASRRLATCAMLKTGSNHNEDDTLYIPVTVFQVIDIAHCRWDTVAACLQPPLIHNSSSLTSLEQKKTHFILRASQLTALHGHALRQTAAFKTHCAYKRVNGRLLTRWHPWGNTPPNRPQSAGSKVSVMETLTASSFCHSSCWQSSGRSQEEGHFIQLSLAGVTLEETVREGGAVGACRSIPAELIHLSRFFYSNALIIENQKNPWDKSQTNH